MLSFRGAKVRAKRRRPGSRGWLGTGAMILWKKDKEPTYLKLPFT